MLGIFKTTLEHANFNRGGVSESEYNLDKSGRQAFDSLTILN
jgi:hypothetical protein